MLSGADSLLLFYRPKNKQHTLLGTQNDLPSIDVASPCWVALFQDNCLFLPSPTKRKFFWNSWLRVSGMPSSTLTMSDWPPHNDVKTSITRKRHQCQKSPRRWPRRMTRLCSISLSTPLSGRHIEPGAWSRKVASLDTRSHTTRHVDASQQERKECDGGGRNGEYWRSSRYLSSTIALQVTQRSTTSRIVFQSVNRMRLEQFTTCIGVFATIENISDS